MILVSVSQREKPSADVRMLGEGVKNGRLAFVLQEITHPRPPSKHKLSDVFHDLRLCLWWQCLKPLCESHFAWSMACLDQLEAPSGVWHQGVNSP